jgi:two-component system, NarL family, response regulator YdfI
LIRVFVRAGSALELAGLEALVRSAPSLELAGSSPAATRLGAASTAAEADVLLEHPLLEDGDSNFADSFGEPDEGGQTRVWMLAEDEFEAGIAAVREGAVRGLLPVWANGSEIRAAVEAAAAGMVVLHPDIAEQVSLTPSGGGTAGDASSVTPGQQLSPREVEVLNLLAAGLGNKQIAPRLGISEHTVKFHVTSIFNKLGASSRAEAVAIGVRRGLIVL